MGSLTGCDDIASIDEHDDDVAVGEHHEFLHPGAGEIATTPDADADADEAVLARLSLPGEGTLTFIDEGLSVPGGRIGLLEQAGAGAPSYVGYYRGTFDATPLELYLALAPGSEPPERLFEDHWDLTARRSAVAHEPRSLPSVKDVSAVQPEPLATTVVTVCNPAHGSGYHLTFIDSSYATHDHAHYLTGSNTAMTGLSTERALGVCVAGVVSPDFEITVRIEVEFTANVWVAVAGPTDLGNISRIHYTSSGFANERYRVLVSNASGDTYHIEGSW